MGYGCLDKDLSRDGKHCQVEVYGSEPGSSYYLADALGRVDLDKLEEPAVRFVVAVVGVVAGGAGAGVVVVAIAVVVGGDLYYFDMDSLFCNFGCKQRGSRVVDVLEP